MKKFMISTIAAVIILGCLTACDSGGGVPAGTSAGTAAPGTDAPSVTDNTEPTTAPETAPDETAPPETGESGGAAEDREPNPGPSTLWGNNLGEPGRVRAPAESGGDFQTGTSYLTCGVKFFYLYGGAVFMQDLNDPQPVGKLVYSDRDSGSGGDVSMIVDREATEANGGEPVLIIFYSPIEGKGKIVSVNTKTGEQTVICDGIGGMLSSFTMYKDTLYCATLMMSGDGMEFYYTLHSVKKDGSDYTKSQGFNASPLWSLEWISGDRIYCSDGSVGHIVSYDLAFEDEKVYEGKVTSVVYVDDRYIYYTSFDEDAEEASLYRCDVNEPLTGAQALLKTEDKLIIGYYDGAVYYIENSSSPIFEFNFSTRKSKKVFDIGDVPDSVMVIPVTVNDKYAVYRAIYMAGSEDGIETPGYNHYVCADYRTGSMWKVQD